jgi:cytochrome c oxidase cbb3-type subunit 3
MKLFVTAALLAFMIQQQPPVQPTPEHPQQPVPVPAPGRGGQTPGRGGQGGGGGGGFANAYPPRAPGDPVAIERGKALYGVHCTFCHGADARGGSGGPTLIRSQIVLSDDKGEKLVPIVQNGLPDRGMPKLPVTTEQVGDIAAFIHSFRASGYDNSRQRPPSIVVGDAKAGEAYFQAKCATCHTVDAMKTFNAKFSDPRSMQQSWLMPGGGGRGGAGAGVLTIATVTLASGERVQGRLVRIDDFTVTLTPEGSTSHTFRRTGDSPKVEISEPLQPHKDLLSVYTDKNIHDVTAFLVTLK